MAVLQAQLVGKDSEFLGIVATLVRLCYSDAITDELMVMMRQTTVPVLRVDIAQAWMTAPAAGQFLELALRHFDLQGNNG